MKGILYFIAGGFVLLLVIGALAGGESDSTDKSAENAAKATPAKTADKPAEKPAKPKSPREQLADAVAKLDAGGYAGELKLVDADINRASTALTFKTPEGGLEGASADDLDSAARAAFTAVYGTAKFPAKETVVLFQGGLVDAKTGAEAPNVNTAIYTLKKADADAIDWSNSDTVEYVIDWSLYRDFVHPAITQ